MEYFPAPLSRAETEDMLRRIAELESKNGFSFLAAELRASGELAGFVGLNVPGYPLPFAPCVEIGWRLAHRFWGLGLAQEGARACLEHGFTKLGLAEIVSFTAASNLKSRNVMEKIGMKRDPAGDFDHPRLPAGHPLARHVLYRKARD
jgi:RimJ/RimL family protein N-acetyltransferase